MRATAASWRFPGLQCARGPRSGGGDRSRSGCGDGGTGNPATSAGPPRKSSAEEQRRRRLRRLRPHARCARRGTEGAAPTGRTSAGGRIRLWRRPRSRQTPGDGTDRRRAGRRRHGDRRQPAGPE